MTFSALHQPPRSPPLARRLSGEGVEGPLAVALALALGVLVAIGAGAAPARAGGGAAPEPPRSEAARAVADPVSGAALFGRDPVAYALGAPALGRADLAVVLGGEEWRFASAANRAAFLAAPEAYRPAFGGRDGALVAAGRLADGDPAVFARVEGRLHLFRDAARRAAYLADEGMRRRAAAAWPALAGEV